MSDTCLSPEEMTALVEGRLDETEHTRLMGHLNECATCSELHAALDATASRGSSLTPSSPAPHAPGALRPAAFSVGDRVGPYELTHRLGSGAHGEVFASYDHNLKRMVALKLLREMSPAQMERFTAEGQALARVRHPSVVTVFDAGISEGTPFVAMELLEGVTLREALEKIEEPLEAVRLLLTAGEGLMAAHLAGVVHRDFKPANVMVTEAGRVVVVDFGLARVVSPESKEGGTEFGSGRSAAAAISQTRSAGTPAYMAPEQHERGAPVDARADQFAFAISLVEALTGKRPFAGDSASELARSKLEGPRLVDLDATLPRALRRAIERALAPQPDERHPTLMGLLHPLAKLLSIKSQRRLARQVILSIVAGLVVTSLPMTFREPALGLTALLIVPILAFALSADTSQLAGRLVAVFGPYVTTAFFWLIHITAGLLGVGGGVVSGVSAAIFITGTALYARPLDTAVCGVLTAIGWVAHVSMTSAATPTVVEEVFALLGATALGVGLAFSASRHFVWRGAAGKIWEPDEGPRRQG